MKIKTFQLTVTFDMAFKDEDYPETKEDVKLLKETLVESCEEEFSRLPNVDNLEVKVKLLDKKESK